MKNSNLQNMDNMSSLMENSDTLIKHFEESANENETLLNVYEANIKDQLQTTINQHSIAGAVAGALPTFGVATTLNLIVLHYRLSKIIDLPVMKNLDKLIAPVLKSIKFAFIKCAILLAIIKVFVSGLEFTGIGTIPGIVIGIIVGFYFSQKAGASFANEIKSFVCSNGEYEKSL